MKKTTFSTLILLLMLLTGCAAQRIVATEQKSATTDTVTVTETLRDTVIRVARDSAIIRALLECDSLGQVHVRQMLKYAPGERLLPPRIEVSKNVLTATATADSMQIYLTLKNRLEKQVSHKSEIISRTVEVNRLTKWQKFRMWLGEIGIIALLVGLGGKIYKLLKF